MKEKKYAEKLINEYSIKEYSKLDALKDLDNKVKRPALIFAYVFGIIAALILGFGMCVAMQVILAELMWLGIILGLLGIAMAILNYFMHKKILNKRKKKYASQIIYLSNSLLNE